MDNGRERYAARMRRRHAVEARKWGIEPKKTPAQLHREALDAEISPRPSAPPER